MSLYLPDAQKVEMLNDYITAEVTSGKVGLFTNADLNVNGALVIGDLTPPAGAWYVPSVVTFGDAFSTGDGTFARQCGSVQFNFAPESGEETVQIWGHYVYEDSSPDVLIGVEKYSEAVEMTSTLDAHIVAPRIEI